MAKRAPITNRTRNLIILVFALSYISICVWSIATTKSWINRRFPGFLVIRNNYVATLYLSGWDGYQKGIRNLDKVLEINGRDVFSPKDLYNFVSHEKPGTPVTYTILRGDRKIKLDIPVSVFTLRDYVICFPGAMLMGFFFIIGGLTLLYLKPASPASWSLLWSFMALGVLYGANGERCTNGVNFLPNIFMPMMGPPLLLFSFYFPVKLRRSRILSILVIALMLLFDVLYVYGYLTGRGFILFDRAYLLFMLISFLFSVVIQVYSYIFTSDKLVRQKAKVAIGGFIVCFMLIVIIYLGAIVPRRNNFFYTSIPAAVLPFFMGYAVAKHNLFDVDVFIRRSLTYVLLSFVVVALFLGIGSLLSIALQDFIGRSSQFATVLSTLLIVLMFNPLKSRIDRVIDRRFFREKYEYTKTIRKASSIFTSIIDLNQLLNRLLETVLDAMKIERGLIALKFPDKAEFRADAVIGYDGSDSVAPIPADHPFIMRMEASQKAVQKNDVEEYLEFEEDRKLHLQLMTELRIVLAVPIVYEGRLIGMFGLSEKKSGVWYTSEDMELLSTLMIQTAVSIENARKVEELKKMVELETSYRELKKLDELKDHFLSMVSHDLRTPMTSIRGYASLLHSKVGKLSEERQKQFSSIIIDESERLTRLINDLLDLQRFEAGKMHLEIKDVNLVEIIRAAAASFRGAAMSKHIEINEDLPEDEVVVAADPDRLSQVVSNLLSNAVKFTPEDGMILVNLELMSENGVRWAKVNVKDSGPGIPEDQQEKLFSKFQHIEGQAQSKEQGSGLGLALVKEIVSYHNGSIGLESEPGKGSAFFFKIKTQMREDSANAENNIDSRR